MRISGIYKITNKLNGKVYIGSSENCYGRWLAHKRDYLIQDNPLYCDIRECGIDNFYFQVIEKIPAYMFKSRKQMYIQKYNSTVPNGYN